MKNRPCFGLFAFVCFSHALSLCLGAAETNNVSKLDSASDDLIELLLKLVAAFSVVIGVLLLGAWCFRKSRLFSLYRTGPAQLRILETRSLGYRNSLFVVGYQDRRYLLAASSTHVNLVSQLPDAEGEDSPESSDHTFAEQLDAIQEPKA